MEPIRNELHGTELATAIGRCWRAAMRAFAAAPAASFREDDELFWLITGLPDSSMNSIMYANLRPEAIDGAVAELRRLRAAYDVPMSWLVGPDSHPPDLGRFLVARGLRHIADLTPMALDMERLAVAPPPPPELEISAVGDDASYASWIETEGRGFEAEGEFATTFMALRRAMGHANTSGFRYWLGHIAGEPVATASLVLAGGIGGIFDIATIPSYRRRGIGSAMVWAMLNAARAAGYRHIFLQSTAMGLPIYERLGFRTVCICGIYE